MLAVGLHGLFWSCKYAIPHMVEAGGGSIINISAHAGVRGVSGFAAYTASKGAMNALTRALLPCTRLERRQEQPKARG